MKRRKFFEIAALIGGSIHSLKAQPLENLRIDNRVDTNVLTEIRVTAPSIVAVGEPFWLGIRMLTTPYFTEWTPKWQRLRATVHGPFNKSSRGIRYMDNVVPEWKGEVLLEGSEGFKGATSYSFSEGSGPYEGDKRPVRRLTGFQFNSPGVKYVTVIDPVTGKKGISNAIVVTETKEEYQLFWGDLHCHSIFGDGVRIPEELYAFARDESFLDVFALTDHTEAITKSQWTYFKEVANDFNEPNRFVTFIGGEWTSPKLGHRNYLYPGNDGPILRCQDPNQDTLQKIYAIAREHGALLVANHTASPGHTTLWENGHDPEVERLVEIYSIGGVNEMRFGMGNLFKSRAKEDEVVGSHAIDGLKRGFKLGFIGAGDDHDGRPGDSLHHLQTEPSSYQFLRGPGLMGVWAEELTRESVFKALWQRRVFGTTNNRTFLQFSINGKPMGAEIQTKGKLSILTKVASQLNILKIELLQEGKIIASVTPTALQYEWKLEQMKPNANTWYYVRISLAEEHIAWATPIWVTV